MWRPLSVCALALLAACCSRGTVRYADHRVDNVIIGPPAKHANLTIYPLYLEDCDQESEYVSLEQALASESAEVCEVSSPSGLSRTFSCGRMRQSSRKKSDSRELSMAAPDTLGSCFPASSSRDGTRATAAAHVL